MNRNTYSDIHMRYIDKETSVHRYICQFLLLSSFFFPSCGTLSAFKLDTLHSPHAEEKYSEKTNKQANVKTTKKIYN